MVSFNTTIEDLSGLAGYSGFFVFALFRDSTYIASIPNYGTPAHVNMNLTFASKNKLTPTHQSSATMFLIIKVIFCCTCRWSECNAEWS